MIVPRDGMHFIEISKDSVRDKPAKNFPKNCFNFCQFFEQKFGFPISKNKKRKRVKFWLQPHQ
jgi:hypothetical protein